MPDYFGYLTEAQGTEPGLGSSPWGDTEGEEPQPPSMPANRDVNEGPTRPRAN
jgi:hypothetical protein